MKVKVVNIYIAIKKGKTQAKRSMIQKKSTNRPRMKWKSNEMKEKTDELKTQFVF